MMNIGVDRWVSAAAVIVVVAGNGVCPFPVANAQTSDYPSKPIRFIVPYASGGPADVVARVIGQKLSENLGQQVVVDLRPGAGGNVGTAAAAKAPPDGYTMVMGTIGNYVFNLSLYKKLPYDPVKDFAPVSLVASYGNVLVVHPSLPVRSVKELVAMALKRPGELNYASAGNGTSIHIAAELFQFMTRTKLVHVPYKGGAPAVVDLVGGHVPIMFDTITEALPHIRSGRLRALGVTGSQRSRNLPDVPTIAEAGVAGYAFIGWTGVFVPAGTPASIVDRLNEEIVKVVQSPEIGSRITQDGADPVGSTPEELARTIDSGFKKWDVVIKKAGIYLD